jgi:Domain of unknown function (DUF222)
VNESQALVARVQQVLDDAVAQDKDTDLLAMARELARTEAVIRARLTQVVAAMSSAEPHDSTEHRHLGEQLRHECHFSGREASELVTCATALRDQLHATRSALQAGAITWSHVTTLVRALSKLGLETVSRSEADWIDRIATQTSPEVLQRVTRARYLELVGCTPFATDSSTVRPEESYAWPTELTDSASSDDAPLIPSTPELLEGGASMLPDEDVEAASREDQVSYQPTSSEPATHNNLVSLASPAPTTAPPTSPVEETSTATSTLTAVSRSPPSSETPDTAAPSASCLHPQCSASAEWRMLSLSILWIDGKESTATCPVQVCEKHARLLADCTVDKLRVSEAGMTGKAAPTLVTKAA